MKAFGDDFQEEFGLEFLDFALLKTKVNYANTPIKIDYRSRPRNSVVYFIGEKPHFYDGKRFLPVISGSTIGKSQ